MANNTSTHAPDVRRDTILVVDDTPETLGFLTDTLDHAGFTALIATDGESALRLIEQITPDLVLMDAVMPGLNGFETCRRMKRNKMLGASARDLHDRPHRNRERARRPRCRRRRLRDQAAGRGRTAGAHSRASRQCARRGRHARRARRHGPIPAGHERFRPAAVVHAEGTSAAGGTLSRPPASTTPACPPP